MKRQYLGDYRDAFKWDLLHWLCTPAESPVRSLLFVPLLTPDDPIARDGLIPHHRFTARPQIQQFVAGLREKELEAVASLGRLSGLAEFSVTVHAPGRFLQPGQLRADYWNGIEYPENAVVFLDPDNGFATKTRKGPKWVRHSEVRCLLQRLPASSAVVVYQHRPHRTWDNVLGELSEALDYVEHASATFDSNLAFLILGRSEGAVRVSKDAALYADHHSSVRHRTLIPSGA